MNNEPDDLEAILAPVNASESPTLRETILQRTNAVQFRRRMVNRVVKVGTLAVVLALGIVIGLESRPANRPQPNVFNESAREPLVIPIVILVPVPAEAPSSSQPVASIEPGTASQAELLAEQADDRSEAARLYRLAGDKYLNDAQDVRNATRCYRLFLSRAADPDLNPAASDTWLLTSLKNAAFKEKFNVAKNDG